MVINDGPAGCKSMTAHTAVDVAEDVATCCCGSWASHTLCLWLVSMLSLLATADMNIIWLDPPFCDFDRPECLPSSSACPRGPPAYLASWVS